MGRVKKTKVPVAEEPSMPPALTIEDQEDELISMAVELAKQRLKDGTASNDLVVQIMRMGTTKERLVREKLTRENEMLRAKTEALQSQRNTEELYAKAIAAMRTYAGLGGQDEYEDDPDLF